MIEVRLDTQLPLRILLSESTDGNMATHTGLDAKDTALNRMRLMERLTTPIQWLNQVHSNRVLAPQYLDPTTPEADGCFSERLFSIGILTADCLPVVLYSKTGERYAAVHAGWRGLINNIIPEAIKHFPEEPLAAFIGPAISQASYQVDTSFKKRFENDWGAWTKKFFTPDGETHFRADLPGLAMHQMTEMGISCENSNYNTAGGDRFYSFRLNKTRSRIATVVGF